MSGVFNSSSGGPLSLSYFTTPVTQTLTSSYSNPSLQDIVNIQYMQLELSCEAHWPSKTKIGGPWLKRLLCSDCESIYTIISHFQIVLMYVCVIHRDKSLRLRIRSWRTTWMSWEKQWPAMPQKTTHPMSFRKAIACCWINSKRPMMSWKCAKRKFLCLRPRLSTPQDS